MNHRCYPNKPWIICASVLAGALMLMCSSMARGAERTGLAAYEAQDLAKHEKYGKVIQAVAGSDWTFTTERVRSLRGWDGGVSGYSFRVKNSHINLDGQPATFRFTLTNWNYVKKSKTAVDNDPDIALSVDAPGYWYYSSESFGSQSPKQWKALLNKVHKALGLPVAKDGIVCRISSGKGVFLSGEDATIGVDLYSIADEPAEITEHWDELPESAVVRRSDGSKVPFKGQPNRFSASSRKWEPGSHFHSSLHISDHYDLTKADTYTIAVGFRYGKEGDVAESQEISIQVLPKESLIVTTKLDESIAFDPYGKIPVEVTLVSRLKQAEIFSDLGVRFEGREINSSPDTSIYYIYSEGRSLTGINQVLKLDMNELKWDRTISSIGPHLSLWDLTKQNKRQSIVARISGKLGGKQFSVRSAPFTVTLDDNASIFSTTSSGDSASDLLH